MSRVGSLVEGAGRLDVGVEGDGDDRKPEGLELRMQGLPPGQLEAAPSPGGPGDEQQLAAPQPGEVEVVAVEIEQRDVGEDDVVQHPTASPWAEGGEPVLLVGHDRHGHATSEVPHVDSAVGAGGEARQRYAGLALAGARWFDLPAGGPEKFLRREVQSIEEHRPKRSD